MTRNFRCKGAVVLTTVLAVVAAELAELPGSVVIDAVTAATPPPKLIMPNLSLEASPKLENNVIRLGEGQSLSIRAKASDPKGYTNVKVEVLGPLPEMAQYQPDGVAGTFRWTPASGTAQRQGSVALTFRATNTFLHTTRVQKLIIAVEPPVPQDKPPSP